MIQLSRVSGGSSPVKNGASPDCIHVVVVSDVGLKSAVCVTTKHQVCQCYTN